MKTHCWNTKPRSTPLAEMQKLIEEGRKHSHPLNEQDMEDLRQAHQEYMKRQEKLPVNPLLRNVLK